MGMSAAPSGGKKARPAPIINVTPLVDVVLCVLIIFMIVTTMMTRTFWMNLPKSEKDAEPSPNDLKPLVLTVDKAGVIRWAKKYEIPEHPDFAELVREIQKL